MAIQFSYRRIEKAVRNSIRPLLVPGAIRALRTAAGRLNSVEEAVALAFDFRWLRIQIVPAQVRSEITQLLKLLAHRPPMTVLEIGTYKGGTFFLFSRVASPEAVLVSLDLPQDPSGVGYAQWQGRLFRSFARERQRIELVLADSRQEQTVERVRQLLNGRSVDFLFIDGDHAYESVKNDFNLYSPLVADDGVIAFHDIVPGLPSLVGGVPQFWQEVKRQYHVKEFVESWSQGAYGIGVIENRGAPPSKS
jgi:predicted O-methyltransferase YrrM